MQNLILHLFLIEGLGPSTIKYLTENENFNSVDFYELSISDFQNIFNLNYTKSKLIVDGLKNKSQLEQELFLIQKNNAQILTIADNDYPGYLKEIENPPSVLYYKGDLKNIENSISIVGSRAASAYGQRVIKKIVPDLVEKGFSIISGGALGIDALAHQETLNSKGKTVAVLGSGLLDIYPTANKKLFDDIVQNGGAVVSPFNLKMAPIPGNFPARNRIVSGISKGTLVIQAAKKSGALITAKYALEQSREVFAVPGLIDDALSEGCNNLIKNGAKLVSGIEDIIQEFDITYSQNSIFEGNLPLENPIVAACLEPVSIDEIHQVTGLDMEKLNIMLFDLQIEGKIRQNFAGLWEKI